MVSRQSPGTSIYTKEKLKEDKMNTPEIPFKHVIVDKDTPLNPHIKAVGDISGNGLADIVIPSSKEGPLVWYEAPDWKKHVIADSGSWSCEAQVVDMDGDGDGDILISDYYDKDLVEWFENPLPDGDPRTDPWKRHVVGPPRAHNIEMGDLEGSGRPVIVPRNQGPKGDKIWVYRQEGNEWKAREFACPAGEGLNLADLDRDGRPEIVIGGRWYKAPDDVLTGEFKEHIFAPDWPEDAMVRCADMNGNGRLDVVLARSEGKHGISWFEAPEDPVAGNWTEHVVDDSVDFCHSLRVCDLNKNGKPDIVAAEMHQSERKRLLVYVNQGDSLTWHRQVLTDKGSHAVCVADTNGNGRLDIVGANWSGDYQPVELWVNLSENK